MPATPSPRHAASIVALASVALAAGDPLAAGDNSARTDRFTAVMYGVGDGLASERVNAIAQDGAGYLWFGTWEALTRFDGVRFEEHGTREGLAHPVVNAIAFDAAGRMWVGTNGGGVACFDGSARGAERAPAPRFRCFAPGPRREDSVVDVLLVDAERELLCGTEGGLFRASIDADGAPRFRRIADGVATARANVCALDARGHAWIGLRDGLAEIEGDAVVRRASPCAEIRALAIDRGELLVAGARSLHVAPIGGAGELAWRAIDPGIADDAVILSVARDAHGGIWIGTTDGLRRATQELAFAPIARRELARSAVHAIAFDREGCAWIAAWPIGVAKLVESALSSWTPADGLPDRNVLRVVPTERGIVGSTRRGMFAIEHDEVRAIPGSDVAPFAGAAHRVARDPHGNWWLGTDVGLYFARGPDLDCSRARRLTRDDGVPESGVFGAIHVDRGGEVWVSTGDGGVFATSTSTDPPRFLPRARDLDANGESSPREWTRDRSGNLWLAPYVGLYRLSGEIVERVDARAGARAIEPRGLHVDLSGRLWIGTRTSGVLVCDEPNADPPSLVQSGIELSSDAVWSITEDARGRLYFGTGRGVARFDRASGRVEHFGSRDGLAGDVVAQCVADERGAVWIATSGGVTRFAPDEPESVSVPPRIYLARVLVAGVELPLPVSGVVRAGPLELDSTQSDVAIDYTSPSFRSTRALAFEHRLVGASDAWSAASDHRDVHFARLAPGDYRFEVRARLPDGTASVEPATLAFTILPPVWRRGWFLAASATALLGAAVLVQRARARRRAELERMRSQIAIDIHDELGAGLAQIAILAEVARREAGDRARAPLAETAAIARELRESTSAIVWAVDPKKDDFQELVARVRQIASNLLESDGLRVDLDLPDEALCAKIHLAPDRRRHLLLAYKEMLANVARHARASHVRVALRADGSSLRLAVADDGRGFDPGARSSGNGLPGLRARASALRGTLSIDASPGRGTSVELVLPLD